MWKESAIRAIDKLMYPTISSTKKNEPVSAIKIPMRVLLSNAIMLRGRRGKGGRGERGKEN